MAIQANLSLVGMYEYDLHILDGLIENLPDPEKIPDDEIYLRGDRIDSEAFINMLLTECAELEMMLPNYMICKTIVRSWAQLNRHKWQVLYNTMYYKYNPIWNKDGTKTHTETIERTAERSGVVTDAGSNNSEQITSRDLTDTENSSVENHQTSAINESGTATHQVSGYNTESFANAAKDITENNSTGNSSETGAGTVTHKGTGTNTVTGTQTNDSTKTSGENSSEKVNTSIIDRETGNIGVTTTQQMISAEREIALFNVVETIIADFKQKFCILVY